MDCPAVKNLLFEAQIQSLGGAKQPRLSKTLEVANLMVRGANPAAGGANPTVTFQNPTAGGANPTATSPPPMIGFAPRTIGFALFFPENPSICV